MRVTQDKYQEPNLIPFDRLPGRITSVPQLLHFYVPPPRPIIPYGQYITDAVDKIANAADPINRAQRQMALAQSRQQLGTPGQPGLMQLQGDVQRQQLEFEREMFMRMHGGGSHGFNPLSTDPQMVPGTHGFRLETPAEIGTRVKTWQGIRNTNADRAVPGTGFEDYAAGHAAATGGASNAPQYVAKPFPAMNVPATDLSTLRIKDPNNPDDNG